MFVTQLSAPGGSLGPSRKLRMIRIVVLFPMGWGRRHTDGETLKISQSLSTKVEKVSRFPVLSRWCGGISGNNVLSRCVVTQKPTSGTEGGFQEQIIR